MQVKGQLFSTKIVDQINSAIVQEPHISRRALSRRICQWLNWRSSRGDWQDGTCRKALAELHRRGVLHLPEVRDTGRFKPQRPCPDQDRLDFNPPLFSGSLTELGSIEVVPVTSRYSKASPLWKGLLTHYHYLKSPRLGGAQIRYLIKSSSHGYLGAMAFSSATLALRDRDRYIGWTDAARRANLRAVVTQDRFLILPTVQVPNLASHLLALALRRLPTDWEARYGVRPLLVETFVDPRHFKGTSYKAANWIEVGETAGRRDGTPKKIFLYPLCPSFRDTLCQTPPIRLGQAPRPESPHNWAEEEFGTLRLYDPRLKARLVTLAQDFYNRPQANIPEACGTKARTIGAYRFFKNEKLTMDVILTPHTEATLERIKSHKVVLAPQDTTILNYSAHPDTQGLGPIHHSDNTAIGLVLHDTMAFTEAGTPLGILDAQCWARDPQEKGKRNLRKALPIDQKESMKWLCSFRKVAEIQQHCPETMLVSIGDREADIYDLFLEACKDPMGPKLLVRLDKSRQRKVEQEPLWTFMAGKDMAGSLKIHLPKRGVQKAREAVVEVRFSEVKLEAPKGRADPPITAWAVYLREDQSEAVAAPIEWMLLTTAAVNRFEEAKQRVAWYNGRWGIEVYHRTLKTGCRIKDRQLGTARRLETCLGVDMVVAWRLYYLTMLGREVPDHPCTVFFEEIEWKALCCYCSKRPDAPQKPPTLKEAIMMVGKMGGHLGRRSDGMPGTECIWRGLQRLDTAVEMYAIFNHLPLPQIRQFYPDALLPPKGGP